MAKLYFKYGAMGSSKTAQVLITKFNYEERGMRVFLIKPEIDTRDGADVIQSRIGLSAKAICIPKDADPLQIFREEKEKYDVIIADECQFFEKEQIDALRSIVDLYGIPVLCSMTFDKRGRTMMGNTVGRVIDELEPLGIDGIGMNCSLGPAEAISVIRSFAEQTTLPLIFKPNAGLPVLSEDGSTVSDYDAAAFVREVLPSLQYPVKYLGGCCGTDPTYIKALKESIG